MSIRVIASAFRIRPEDAAATASVERLYDRVFGPARFQKASHRFRRDLTPVHALSWLAREGSATVGAVRYWPIEIGNAGENALLLGPLAVAPDHQERGIGRVLVRKTLDLAAKAGHDLVLLVGDCDYYVQFGFEPATPHGFVMPGETRPGRLQALSLQGKPLHRVDGMLRRCSIEPIALRTRAM